VPTCTPDDRKPSADVEPIDNRGTDEPIDGAAEEDDESEADDEELGRADVDTLDLVAELS
jgi:hypothetical protein